MIEGSLVPVWREIRQTYVFHELFIFTYKEKENDERLISHLKSFNWYCYLELSEKR